MRAFTEPGGLESIRLFSSWGSVVEETPELTAFQIVISTEAVLEDSHLREWVRHRHLAVHGLITSLIREGIDRGEIHPDVDVDGEASALIAFLDGVRLQWFYSDPRLPIAPAVERYFDLLIGRLTDGV